MVINRLLYLALLILSLVFYFASGIWVSWLLLVLVALLPFLTLLISLPAMLSSRLKATMADTVNQGENTSLHIQLRSWRLLPVPDIQICLNLRTSDRERDLRYLSHLSREEGVLNLPTDNCGYLIPEFRKGRTYDTLGLFRLPMKLPRMTPMAILPPERMPDPMPELLHLLQQEMKPKPGGGYSELHDHRPYRPGDPVKDIHWKLSLKSDELVVREALEPIQRKVILALRTPHDANSRSINLGNLRYLSRWLLEHEVAHQIIWMKGTRIQSREVHSEDDILSALRSICLVSGDSADLPWPLPLRAEHICPVGLERGEAE